MSGRDNLRTHSPCSVWLASASHGVGAAQVNPFASMRNAAPNYAGGVGQITASGAIIKFYTISGSATVRSTGQAGTGRSRARLSPHFSARMKHSQQSESFPPHASMRPERL